MADTRKECCRLEENLGPQETSNPEKPEFTFRRCSACQCRHFVLKADPGVIGLKGSLLGARLVGLGGKA